MLAKYTAKSVILEVNLMEYESRKGRKARRIAEPNPAVPGVAPERRFFGLHAAGPRAPRDAVLNFTP